MNKSTSDTSKFLSFVLRHRPESIGLIVDAQGWVYVDHLVDRANANGHPLDLSRLLHIIHHSGKKRFTLSADGNRVRAAQGHSINIELQLEPLEPPAILYHGTATQFIQSVLTEGLKPQSRQYVHLSTEKETAQTIGRRHGKPVVLRVDSASMHTAGLQFFQADNGVWLTNCVPAEFVQVVNQTESDHR